MACERFREALTDAAVGGPVAKALEAHVAECPACAAELAALQGLMAAADDELSALATAEPSPALRVRIREAVAEANAAPAFRWGFAWTATAAAALALAAFGVWRVSVSRGPVSPSVAVNAPPPLAASQPRANALPSTAPVAVISPTAVPAPAGLPSESAYKATSVRRVKVRQPATAEPEVLVPVGEQQALLHYVALVNEEKARPDALLAVGQPSRDLPENEIEIAPLDRAAEEAETK